MMSRLKVTSYQMALMSVFAALYYVLSLISPFIPSIGLPQLQIQLEALIATVFGFILGPYLGAAAAFFGAVLAWILPPGSMSAFGIPFLLSPPINAFVVGLVFYRRWKWAFTVYGCLIAIFLLLPPAQPLNEQYLVPIAVLWDKIIALLLLLPIIRFSRKLSEPRFQSILFFILAFVGNQADNMWGANIFAVPLVYESIFGLDVETVRSLFTVSPFIYPAIRIIQATFATIIAVPIVRALKNTKWMYGESSILMHEPAEN
jgi:hypothetical protein